MDRIKSFLHRLAAKRVRLEKPSPGVDWAEGLLANERRVGEWVERIGNTTERTTWRDGKKHGPSRRVHDDGTPVIERSFFDDEPHGEFRSFHDDGKPFCTCAYEHGALVGRYTHHDAAGSLTVDFTSRAGRKHGTYRDRASNGVVTLEGEYVDGKREGTFTRRTDEGVVIELATYTNDVLDGDWSRFFPDGKRKLATTYRAGLAATFEAWSRAGFALEPISAGTPEDAARLVDLADALDAADDDAITSVVHALPAKLAEDAVRLCDARAYRGFQVLASRQLVAAGDPRLMLVRRLSLDHARLSAKHFEALRANRRLVELKLHEVDLLGSLPELLAAGAAMRLERLALTECHGDHVIEGLVVLADSDVADRLEELTLDVGDRADHASAMGAILRSPRLARLARLRVDHAIFSAMDALAEGPRWPALRELTITSNVPVPARNGFMAALKQRAFPALSRLEINDVLEDDASRAFAERLTTAFGVTVEG